MIMKPTAGRVRALQALLLANLAVASISSASAASIGGATSRASGLLQNNNARVLAKHQQGNSKLEHEIDLALLPAGAAAVSVTGGEEVPQRKTSVGVLGVLGGALCHLVLGTTYCWGNFGPYMPAKLKYFSGKDTGGSPDSSYVLAGTFVAQTLAMPLGPYFHRKIGCQATATLGVAIMALGVFLSSFAPNLYAFMFCYSFMFGSGVGLAYTAPMVNGWKWFPDKKGLVSGAVVAGFGSGGFVFNQVGTRIINPKGLNAVAGLYPKEIYDNFPVMLRRLSYIYITMGSLGALAIQPPPQAQVKGDGRSENVVPVAGTSLGDALRQKKFWLMWFMVLMIATSGINVANNYKAYAGTVAALQSDQFQSVVGSVGALCNGAGRLFWGNMLDSFGFKRMFAILAAIQTVATASYTMLSQSKAGFLFGTGLLLFCLGGNFAMFPALTTKVFGNREGAKIYGFVFSAFAVASIFGSKLTKVLIAMDWDWEQVFKLMAALSMCSLAALPMFHP